LVNEVVRHFALLIDAFKLYHKDTSFFKTNCSFSFYK
jgi:hypothetical protein